MALAEGDDDIVSYPGNLRGVGFWQSKEILNDDHTRSFQTVAKVHQGHPAAKINHRWFEDNQQVVEALANFFGRCYLESYELGYSFCRLGCVPPDSRTMGACNMTDSVYVWPEGYSHYVFEHHVKPPPPFLDHVVSVVSAWSSNGQPPPHALMQWDIVEGKVVDIPQSTKKWLKEHTLLSPRLE